MLLQGGHDAAKLAGGYLITAVWLRMTDIVILTEGTGETAAAEEDGAGTMLAHQHRFLAKMRAVACHLGVFTRPADTSLSRQAVDPAPSRAEGAAGQHPAGLVDPILQLPRLVQAAIVHYGVPARTLSASRLVRRLRAGERSSRPILTSMIV